MEERDVPSSRTSIMASEGGGVDASRLEEVWAERMMAESVAADMRGMVETVIVDILRIYVWQDTGESAGRGVGGRERI